MDFYLNQKNEKGFENAFLQVKQFYFDYANIVKTNPRMEYFTGLFLLHLLSNNRNTEYCSELELLSLNHINNQFISLAVVIDNAIQEGNYNKLINLQCSLKEPAYSFYLSKLNSSVRYQIARSAEKSFTSISVTNACELLLLNNLNELIDFIKQESEKYGSSQEINWIIQDNKIWFKEAFGKDKIIIPSHKLVTDTVKLAVDLEKII